jgi:hypothetical protein
MKVFREEVGIELPDYAISAFAANDAHHEVTSHAGVKPWQVRIAIGEEQRFDVAVLKGVIGSDVYEMHTGIMTKPGWILHTEKAYGVVHVPLNNAIVRGRVTGIYRHEALVHAVAA